MPRIKLSRNEILEMLKIERERVIKGELPQDSKKAIAMYDAVIKAYSGIISQNRTCKNVRMADGSRRWLPNGEAEKLLALPRKDRV